MFFIFFIYSPCIRNCSTQENITFSISAPHRFVFNISADDFDMVFQAVCQDTMRSMIRKIELDLVNDLVLQDLSGLRDTLNAEMEGYGVTIMRINFIAVQSPDEFMRSQEARKLALLHQAEQAETQALAVRRQTDADTMLR